MKAEFAASGIAAVICHALLLFGFQLSSPARPLTVTDDTAPVDVNLIEPALESPTVAPPTNEPPRMQQAPTPLPQIRPPVPDAKPAPMETPPPDRRESRAGTSQTPIRQPLHRAVSPVKINAAAPALTAHPQYRSNPKPVYPVEARTQRQEGTVLLSVQVSADGRALSVVLKRSSGYPSFDNAATQAVRGWRFEPARSAGIAIASRVDVPVRFSLSESRR